MKKLDQLRQESKEIKEKIDHTEERLRQLKNQEKKILKQDIEKRKKTEELLLGFCCRKTPLRRGKSDASDGKKGFAVGLFLETVYNKCVYRKEHG